MSSKYEPQIWGNKSLDFSKADNKTLSKEIVTMLKKHYPTKPVAYVASDLGINRKRVDNWMFMGIGMTAFYLLLLMRKYEFIREWVDEVKFENTRYF